MNYTQFRKKTIEHLSDWIIARNPGIASGEYRGNALQHVLPISPGMRRKDAIVDAICRYNVLTDGVVFDKRVFPPERLHYLANHLTSSQILCYNFFRLFLPDEICTGRQIRVTSALRQWLAAALPGVRSVADNAVCEFEYIPDAKEGTSFDFSITDGTTIILFEIKYTENGFGKARDDNGHNAKFDRLYSALLKSKRTLRSDIGKDVFLKYYQLSRNAIRTNDDTWLVVMFPGDNEACRKQLEEFCKECVAEHAPNRILSLTWEDAIAASELSAASELKNKSLLSNKL